MKKQSESAMIQTKMRDPKNEFCEIMKWEKTSEIKEEPYIEERLL